jgi:thiol-disulfide isomerase/thioredoxin
MRTGLALLVAVLLAATAFGLWRRATDGRMKNVATAGAAAADVPVPPPDGSPEVDVHTASPAERVGEVLTAEDLGTPLGGRATLVQFSTAFCQPCRATRLVLDDVAGQVDGVVHVEVDAESHLDLVRRVDVMRTPTVLVLDSAGRIRKRATGQPRKADVYAAIGEVVGPRR